MAQDITKNSGDIENYSKEFVELQGQLNQISRETFNGISLFSDEMSPTRNASSDHDLTGISQAPLSIVAKTEDTSYSGGGGVYADKFGRSLLTHQSGVEANGSALLNVANLQYVLSIGSTVLGGVNNVDLGGLNSADDSHTAHIGADGFIDRILDVNVSQFTVAIERLADLRAENGAEQNRVMNSIQMLQTNVTNLEAAHGRIMDADIALESTRFARQNVLVQASASMAAQANQMTNVALMLLG